MFTAWGMDLAETLLTPALGVSHFFPHQGGVFLCLKNDDQLNLMLFGDDNRYE